MRTDDFKMSPKTERWLKRIPLILLALAILWGLLPYLFYLWETQR